MFFNAIREDLGTVPAAKMLLHRMLLPFIKFQAFPEGFVIQRFLDFLQQEVRAPAARANQPQIALLSQLATPRAANTSHMVEKP